MCLPFRFHLSLLILFWGSGKYSITLLDDYPVCSLPLASKTFFWGRKKKKFPFILSKPSDPPSTPTTLDFLSSAQLHVEATGWSRSPDRGGQEEGQQLSCTPAVPQPCVLTPAVTSPSATFLFEGCLYSATLLSEGLSHKNDCVLGAVNTAPAAENTASGEGSLR